MSFVISPAIPFPNIQWFAQVAHAGRVVWDGKEHFEKMSYRNRYHIATAQGVLTLSIPLEQGRDQRGITMEEMRISYRQDWPLQHWRTITAAYARSPYFSHYEQDLKPIFETQYEKLFDFNVVTMRWLKAQLRLKFEEEFTTNYIKSYSEEGAIDIRSVKPKDELPTDGFRLYMQVFADRTGFLPNLSMLDLLFAEGPYAATWLAKP